MAPATLKSISRGEAPPFDAASAKKECEIPSDQQTLLKSTPGWTNQKKTLAPIDDTPEEFEASQQVIKPTAAVIKPPTSPSGGRYMAKQRALQMDDDDSDEDAERENAKENEPEEYLVKAAPGVKPLVLANASEQAAARRTKKPTVVYDDDDDDDDDDDMTGRESIMPTQTASQMALTQPISPPRSPPKRQKTTSQEDEEVPASPPIGFIKRAINTAAEALGLGSPFKSPSAHASSPGLPRSLMMSPRTMNNVVGSVARSVLDDEDARGIDRSNMEWGSKGGYAAGSKAKRKLKLDDDGDDASGKRTRKSADASDDLFV